MVAHHRFLLSAFLALVLPLCEATIRIKGVSGQTGLTQDEQNAMVEEHNALRSRVAQGQVGSHPKAADMTRMVRLKFFLKHEYQKYHISHFETQSIRAYV